MNSLFLSYKLYPLPIPRCRWNTVTPRRVLPPSSFTYIIVVREPPPPYTSLRPCWWLLSPDPVDSIHYYSFEQNSYY